MASSHASSAGPFLEWPKNQSPCQITAVASAPTASAVINACRPCAMSSAQDYHDGYIAAVTSGMRSVAMPWCMPAR